MSDQRRLLKLAQTAEERAHTAVRIAQYPDITDDLLRNAHGALEGSARAAIDGMSVASDMLEATETPVEPDPVRPPTPGPEVEPPPIRRTTPEVHLPSYEKPTEFDWLIDGTKARRISDGHRISGGNLIPQIFDLHTPGVPLRVKLLDDYHDKLQIGWGYNPADASLVARPIRGGYAPVHLTVVGPDEGRAVMGHLLLGGQFSRLDKLALHGIAITGPDQDDARGAVTGFDHIPGRVGLLDFEIRQHPGSLRLEHGIYIGGGCDEFHMDGRADVGDPRNGGHRTRFYHHFAYRKSVHRSSVVNCGLAGGGRTGDQHRPQALPWGGGTPVTARPSGDAYLIGNTAYGAGWDSPWAQGGQRLTEWSRPDGFILVQGNEILDERYGCFGVSVQLPEHGNYLTETGHTTREVYLTKNRFENPRGDRPTIMLSSTMFARIDESNEIVPPADGRGIWIDSDFAKAQPDFAPSLEFEIAEKFKPITYIDGHLAGDDPRITWI